MKISNKKKKEIIKIIKDSFHDHLITNYPDIINERPEYWSDEELKYFDSMAELEHSIITKLDIFFIS